VLISKTISSLINGVTRQPAALRLSSQAQEQLNMFSTVATGPTRRPPIFHVAKLNMTVPSTVPFIHLMDRDATTKHLVVITGAGAGANPKIFSAIDGSLKTLTNALTTAQMTAANPRQDYRAISVADYTYLVNKNITPALGTIASEDVGIPTFDRAVMIWMTGMNYSDSCGFRYQSQVGAAVLDHSISYTSSTTVASVAIGAIISTLRGTPTPGVPTGCVIYYSATDPAGLVLVTAPVGTVLRDARAVGGSFASYFRSANQTVQQFSDLPPVCLAGQKMKVQGTPSATFDIYYVQFAIESPPAAVAGYNSASVGAGYWRETFNGARSMDAATFPYGLRPKVSGTDFEIVALGWGSRLAGDDNTSPSPSIVGVPIADLIFHRNRLGLSGGEILNFSEVAEYYNLWPTTVTTSVDSDPVDVQLTHNRISNIRHVIPFNEQLVLFTDVGQHILRAQSPEFTTKNLSSELVTAFQAKADVRPCLIGDRIIFVQDQGTYTTAQEFLAEEQVDGYKVESITAHIDDYLPPDITRLFGSASHRTMFALSDYEASSIYVYRYFHAGKDKVMSSWSRITIDCDRVVFGDISDNRVYLVLEKASEYHLCYMDMDLTEDAIGAGADWLVHLDYRKTVAGTWDAGANAVVWNSIGYDTAGSLGYAVFLDNGETITLEPNASHTGWMALTATRNDGRSAVVGIRYLSQFELSPVVHHKPGTNEPITTGRLQMRTMKLLFANTGRMTVYVNGSDGGNESYITDHAAGTPQDGEIRVPILRNSKDYQVTASTFEPHPMSLVAAEWEAEYFARARSL